MKSSKLIHKFSALFITGLGLLTLFLSSSILFYLFGDREREGNFVPFIVWANFISSILYLFAAYGFIKVRRWTAILLGIASLILITSFILLKLHIADGGLYETKTVSAMIFRTGLTMVFTGIAYFSIQKRNLIS